MDSSTAWACGIGREAMGTLCFQVCRKGQQLSQTNAKTFRAQPTTGLRSCLLHALAHLACREVTRPSQVWKKTHHSTRPLQWPGSCTWGAAKQKGPERRQNSNLCAGTKPVPYEARPLCAGPINNRKCKRLRQRFQGSKPWL